MNPSILLTACLYASLALPLLRAQEWSAEKLAESAKGFQSESFAERQQQIGALLQHRADNFTAIANRIHGDHREYLLLVERLLRELTDERWTVRENAERTLIEIGGRAKAMIQNCRDDYEFVEQNLRCTRILQALTDKGEVEAEREQKLLRGLVQTALYLDAEPRLLRALRSALGHTDPSVVEAAIRALGKLGGDDDVAPVAQMLDWKGCLHRPTALAALGRMRSAKALATCRDLLAGGKLTNTEMFLVLRALHSRDDEGARVLLAELATSPSALLAAGAGARTAQAPGTTPAHFQLPDKSRATLAAGFGGFHGESVLVHGGFTDLPIAELAFGEADVIDFDHAPAPLPGARVFLTQGSLAIGELIGIDAAAVTLDTPRFGRLRLPRRDIQGLAIDPGLDRLVGASVDHDRIRLRTDRFLDGQLLAATAEQITLQAADGSTSQVPMADVAGILFTRPRVTEQDTTTYTRLDLVTGERLVAFVADASGTEIAVAAPILGAVVIPLAQVRHLELGVGGGALWGFTLIADYSENRVLEVDDQGRVVFQLEDVFGAWDAECLDNGNLLITEFSVSRVQEIDRKGKMIWVFEELKNPYDADRLPNGHTLIADTFGGRVIEVDPAASDPAQRIVWSYADNIRPFDCDRLLNGNTLICDILANRVIEVNQAGELVWSIDDVANAHDADRLPNGNTLVTLRSQGKVCEYDRDGNVVWELTGLGQPSDADRLPNGHTLVAENEHVREFDRRGTEVWRKEAQWAVEVNRY